MLFSKVFPIAREPMGTSFYPCSLTYVARLKGKLTQPLFCECLLHE
jgi:hypothetical protein